MYAIGNCIDLRSKTVAALPWWVDGSNVMRCHHSRLVVRILYSDISIADKVLYILYHILVMVGGLEKYCKVTSVLLIGYYIY